MSGTRITGPRLLEWDRGLATAPDGTRYEINSEWPYGVPPRIYKFEILRPGEQYWTGGHHAEIEGIERDDFAPSTSKQTTMNRAERHAREFHA